VQWCSYRVLQKYVNGHKSYCGGGRVCDQAQPILFCNDSRVTPQVMTSVIVLTCVCLLIVGVESYCCTWSDSVTHTHSAGLAWTRDQPDAETSICTTHNTRSRQTSMPPAEFEPAISAFDRPQTKTSQTARPLGLA
jgi:hypothetical protein